MAYRWVVACGFALLTAGAAVAQGVPTAPAAPDCLDQPTYLPPLLRPPVNDPHPPLAVVPRGPVGEYDHGQFYLPEYVPSPGPEACRPLGRWWINTSFEFAWVPARRAPTTIRLRVPDGAGGTIPGPVLPVAGLSTGQFQGGFGLSGGRWFDAANTRGFDASFLFVSGGDRTFDGFAPAMLVLFPNGPDRSAPQVVVFPSNTPILGIFPTTLSTWYTSADVNYRQNIYCGPNVRLDALAGYRFAFLQDEIYLGQPPDGSHNDYQRNRISVTNPFHGGQVGLASEYHAGNWYVGGTAKVAFGAVTPDVCASGLFVGAEGATASGGYARLATLADTNRSQFAVLPLLNVTLGRQIREQGRVFVGYSFQYLSRVARLGDVLDSTATAVQFTNFWVQSFNVGLELRY